jgi:hypothetical protein
MSVTCNVTALRYAVTLQACTHLKLIIRHYNDDEEDKLVNECRQFKEYLRLVNAQDAQCPEILQLVFVRKVRKVYPNLTIIHKIYMAIPTSREAEINFSKLSRM